MSSYVSFMFMSVVNVICLIVFGIVMVLIVSSFFIEKCSFMLNIRRIMFSLVSCGVRFWLVMKLGVNGFVIMFVIR